jgi:hypothetical protein
MDGLRRIRSKLSQAIADSTAIGGVILFDERGNAIKLRSNDSTAKAAERTYKLVKLIEYAVSIGSTIQCIPAHVREDRIASAYRSDVRQGHVGASSGSPESRRSVLSESVDVQPSDGNDGKGTRTGWRKLLPTETTPFDNPQTYSVPRRN